MPERCSRTEPPYRLGQKLCPQRSIVIALVKIRTQIVTLEVGKDVLYKERLQVGQFQGLGSSIVHDMKQSSRGREKAVKDSVDGIVDGFDVGYPAVLVDLQILDVAGRAADGVEHAQSILGAGRLLAGAGLEVVEQIKLHIVHNGGVNLVWVLESIARRRCLDCIPGAVQYHTRRSYYTLLLNRRSNQIGIGASLETHLSVQRPHDKLTHGNRPAMRKEGPHPQVWINSLYLGSVYMSKAIRRDEPEIDPLADQRQRHRFVAFSGVDGLFENVPQISSDLIGQHLFQSQAEQMRSAAAIRPGHHVPSKAGRTARPRVTTPAAAHQTSSNPYVDRKS